MANMDSDSKISRPSMTDKLFKLVDASWSKYTQIDDEEEKYIEEQMIYWIDEHILKRNIARRKMYLWRRLTKKTRPMI